MKLTPEEKIGGVLAPLFALRTEEDLGVGNVTALREFVDWASGWGLRMVQILPINETGADNSPYNAISSVALEPTTLDCRPSALEDLTPADYARLTDEALLPDLRVGHVRYNRIKPLVRKLLHAAFENFCDKASPERLESFAAFQRKNVGWLPDYTLFRALMHKHEDFEVYDQWPEEHSSLAKAREWVERLTPREFEELHGNRTFFAYVQWVAWQQWSALRDYALSKGVVLMGDIPIGCSYYSADVWGAPANFLLNWSGGAPPEPAFQSDPFTTQWGQNWGVPIYDWGRMYAENFPWWRQRVTQAAQYFSCIRIDHVLGFYRMYAFPWRPQRNLEYVGLSKEQAAERNHGQLPEFKDFDDATVTGRNHNAWVGRERIQMVIEAAGETVIAGEDLGVVPPYVRPSLLELGVPGFRIPQWEKNKENGMLFPGDTYDRVSITTWATHDHMPLKTWWNSVVDTAALPLEEVAEWDHLLRANIQTARWEIYRVSVFAGLPVYEEGAYPRYNEEIHEQLLRALFQSNSWIALHMITDYLGTEQRFNVPGSVAESNWSERLEKTVRQLTEDPEANAVMAKVRQMLEETGRMPLATPGVWPVEQTGEPLVVEG
jgi:4-alpha-glucanotransferase